MWLEQLVAVNNAYLESLCPISGGGKSHSARYHCPREGCRGIVKSLVADKVHKLMSEPIEHITPSDGIVRLYKQVLNRQALVQLGN